MQALYLLLGSNRGNRLDYLLQAKLLLETKFNKCVAASAIYETAPWGNTHQPAFYNQALLFNSEISALDILKDIKAIEQQCGRVFSGKWNEREIDIDILLYGSIVFESEALSVPHKMLHQRRFALTPLCEIAPDFLHPVLNQTIATLLNNCEDTLLVNKIVIQHEV
jgi:2-amino-4-hydroxy-6-hydroxymethyldihydropteridine diphosphokinase